MIERYNCEYCNIIGENTMCESEEGEWVRYDDIKYLLQNTSSNSDYVAAITKLINAEVDCVQTKNGAYVNLDGVINCLNHVFHDFT